MSEPTEISAPPSGTTAAAPPACAEHQAPEPGRVPYVSYALIGLCVLVFLAMLADGVSLMEPGGEALVKWGANFAPLTAGGQPWRLMTSLFLHVGLIHILLNMYVLLDCGPAAERFFGSRNFLIVYLLSGIGGCVASVSWNPVVLSAGASGAIFGVIGALLALLRCRKNEFPPEFFQQHMKGLLGFVGYNVIFGLTFPHIDNAAHFGGLAAGFAAGFVLAPVAGRSGWKARQYAGIGVLALLMAGGFVFSQIRVARSAKAEGALLMATPKVTFGKQEEVYYRDGATKSDAERLGGALQKMGIFNGTGGKTVALSRARGDFQVSMVLGEAAWTDPKMVEEFKSVGALLSAKAFDGQPFELRLCDSALAVRHTLQIPGDK